MGSTEFGKLNENELEGMRARKDPKRALYKVVDAIDKRSCLTNPKRIGRTLFVDESADYGLGERLFLEYHTLADGTDYSGRTLITSGLCGVTWSKKMLDNGDVTKQIMFDTHNSIYTLEFIGED